MKEFFPPPSCRRFPRICLHCKMVLVLGFFSQSSSTLDCLQLCFSSPHFLWCGCGQDTMSAPGRSFLCSFLGTTPKYSSIRDVSLAADSFCSSCNAMAQDLVCMQPLSVYFRSSRTTGVAGLAVCPGKKYRGSLAIFIRWSWTWHKPVLRHCEFTSLSGLVLCWCA